MADPAPQQNESIKEKAKVKVREFPLFVWNSFVRLPGIRRFRWGRVKVGGREPPLYYDLQHWWLEVNKDLFVKNLQKIETKWPEESRMMGYGDPKKNEQDTILGNKEGIVPLYQRLGQYSDVERASIETNWFLSGSGTLIENMDFKVPDDEKEWARYGWNQDVVRKFRQGTSKLAMGRKSFRIKLSPGIVYHEGKREYKETLHVFGRSNVEKISGHINDIDQMFNLESAQAAKIPTEIRTRFGYASAALKKLAGEIQELETKAYDKLHDLEGDISAYLALSESLVDSSSPEYSQAGIIRFPHTYKVIKQYYIKKITEEIEERDPRGTVSNRYSKVRYVPVYLEGSAEIYNEEVNELTARLNNLRAEMNVRLQELNRIIAHLQDLISHPDRFRQAVRDIANTQRAPLRAIIDDPNLEPEVKADRINGFFRHAHAGIDHVLKEKFQNLRFDIAQIVSSARPADEKINEIVELIIVSLRATKLIEFELAGKKEEIKAAFNPVRTEGKEKIDKTADEIFGELKSALYTRSAVIKNILDGIFTAKEAQIRSLIVLDSSAVDLDNAYAEFVRLITEESRRHENENAGIEDIHERQGDIARYLGVEFRGKYKDYEVRLKEIANITPDSKRRILESLQRRPDNFYKRGEEVALGLDEYGYPLEIDPKTGAVLIDKWWIEIGGNTWQLEKIAGKAGGAAELRNHLGLTVDMSRKFGERVSGTAQREQRYLVDDNFHGSYDLLETGCLIFGMWDSFRDDLRDGRYHPNSKTFGDYLIEGEGGYDEKLGAPYMKNWFTWSRRMGDYIARRGIFHFSRINLHFNESDLINANPYQYVNSSTFINDNEGLRRITNARPEWFHSHNTIPSDEDAVKRDYRMKMPDNNWFPPEEDGKMKFNKRSPSKYNPAFDRSAESLPFIFWGNMYYWRWAGAINEWSENPFPTISTRGIAHYIFYLAVSDVWKYEDAIRILEGVTEPYEFDYGIRGQGAWGKGGVNPASGKNVTEQEN